MELVHFFFHSSLQGTKEDSSWTKTTEQKGGQQEQNCSHGRGVLLYSPHQNLASLAIVEKHNQYDS